jgi:hypothetical protein
MSVYWTIFWARAVEEGPRRDNPNPTRGEPYTVDVAVDTFEREWLRISVSDDLLPEGCSAVIDRAQALGLLESLQRWAEGLPEPAPTPENEAGTSQ